MTCSWKCTSGRWLVALLLVLSGQTTQAQDARAQVLTQGLEHPWALAFLPTGRMLVTERPGRMRLVEPDGRLGPAVAGVPDVAAAGQGGLLDLLLDADFERNRRSTFAFPSLAPGATARRWPGPP